MIKQIKNLTELSGTIAYLSYTAQTPEAAASLHEARRGEKPAVLYWWEDRKTAYIPFGIAEVICNQTTITCD